MAILVFALLGITLYDPFNNLLNLKLPNLDWVSRAVIGSQIGAILTGFLGFIFNLVSSGKWPSKTFSGTTMLIGGSSLGLLVNALLSLDPTLSAIQGIVATSLAINFIGYSLLWYHAKEPDNDTEKSKSFENLTGPLSVPFSRTREKGNPNQKEPQVVNTPQVVDTPQVVKTGVLFEVPFASDQKFVPPNNS